MQQMQPVKLLIREKLGWTPSPATIWRWARKGVGGRRLRVRKIGKALFATEADLREFCGLQAGDSTPCDRSPDDAAELRRAGLIG